MHPNHKMGFRRPCGEYAYCSILYPVVHLILIHTNKLNGIIILQDTPFLLPFSVPSAKSGLKDFLFAMGIKDRGVTSVCILFVGVGQRLYFNLAFG